jgi:signal transduction histidine kinase
MDEINASEVIIYAPTGKDAELIGEALKAERILVSSFKTEKELFSRLIRDSGAFIVAEEALKDSVIKNLKRIFSSQEPWSDIPIIVLTFGGLATPSAIRVQETFSSHGNVTLLERPFRKATLVSTVQVALRSRAKQYQVRELLKKQVEATLMRDEFISIAGHELKTPLTSLKLHTQINQRILSNPKSGPLNYDRVQKMVETTDRQVSQLVRLVDDMLDVSRVATGKLAMNLQPTDLSKLTEEVVDGMRASISEAHSPLTLEIEPGVQVLSDNFRIEQVLNNLLTNAVRYAPGKPISIKCSRDGDFAKIEVSDRGPGIPEEDQARIFERFERAANSGHRSGLGLGLYICKEIMTAHHGKIEVTSELTIGTTFSVLLPVG